MGQSPHFWFRDHEGYRQKHSYRRGNKIDPKISIDVRFRGRPSETGNKNDRLLVGDAMGQVRKGWVRPPLPLTGGRIKFTDQAGAGYRIPILGK